MVRDDFAWCTVTKDFSCYNFPDSRNICHSM